MSSLAKVLNLISRAAPQDGAKQASPPVQRNPKSKPQMVEGGASKPIRVLLADDHPVVRQGLSCCLALNQQIKVVGEASDGQEALLKAKELSPDVVLMDVEMPKLNGLAAMELLRKENPRLKVLILSVNRDPEYVLRILRSGAHGYLLKESSPEEWVRAIQAVDAGETFFTPDLTRSCMNQLANRTGEGPHPAQLSNREREVVIAIAEGLSNKEIACRLDIGVRTIETHRERIMRKLNIHSVAGLTRFAVMRGMVGIPGYSKEGFA
jgi:two-component system nitrate/nitrite response regulator NarL